MAEWVEAGDRLVEAGAGQPDLERRRLDLIRAGLHLRVRDEAAHARRERADAHDAVGQRVHLHRRGAGADDHRRRERLRAERRVRVRGRTRPAGALPTSALGEPTRGAGHFARRPKCPCAFSSSNGAGAPIGRLAAACGGVRSVSSRTPSCQLQAAMSEIAAIVASRVVRMVFLVGKGRWCEPHKGRHCPPGLHTRCRAGDIAGHTFTESSSMIRRLFVPALLLAAPALGRPGRASRHAVGAGDRRHVPRHLRPAARRATAWCRWR